MSIASVMMSPPMTPTTRAELYLETLTTNGATISEQHNETAPSHTKIQITYSSEIP